MLAPERLEDTDARLGIDLEGAVVLEVAELTGGGVVERENDRSRPGRQGDAPVEEVSQVDQPIALGVERLEVATEVLRRPSPALFGVVDLVILENHDAPELVGGELTGAGERYKQQSRREDQ